MPGHPPAPRPQRADHARNDHLTFRANAGVGRHGWLRLTPAYGVRLVRERISHLPPGSVVTDPFSGTGTTPLAAAELGHLGQSRDVNPFLVWLGGAKTRHYDDVVARLEPITKSVCEEAAAVLPGAPLWQPALHNIDRWWSPGRLRALAALRAAIDAHAVDDVDPDLLDLLNLALCRTLMEHSNAAFNHQSMSFKASAAPAGIGHKAVDAREGERTLALFAASAAALADSARRDLPGTAVVVPGDSRTSLNDLEPCDLLLTSPPYVNRMSYVRELRPYMYWLRFLDAPADAGDLDWRAVGGTWGTATSKLTTWQPATTTPVDAVLADVCERIRAEGGKNGGLLATYVRKYFHDMWAHFGVAGAHVKPGGRATYVIGNSTFYGVEVPAEQWYATMLGEAGFDSVTVEPIRKRNSNKALFEFEVSGLRAT